MPSQAEVEAAAKAAYKSQTDRSWKLRPGRVKQQWRDLVRAALEAAEEVRTDEPLEAKRATDELLIGWQNPDYRVVNKASNE